MTQARRCIHHACNDLHFALYACGSAQETSRSTRSHARKRHRVKRKNYYRDEEETQGNPHDDAGVHEGV